MDNSNPQPFRGGPFLDGGHHGGGHVLQWVIFALQLLMLAALAVLLVRAFAARPHRGPGDMLVKRRLHRAPPEDVLRHRYARGEIDREEYLQASHDLGSSPPPPEDAPTGEL